MSFVLIALCRRGKAQYSIDTQEVMIKPNDLIIISDRHIIDNYMASPDLEGLCIMLSRPFYYEFVQRASNVSSLLLFSLQHPVVTLTPDEVQVFCNYFSVIKKRIAMPDHHYRKELVSTLLLAMFYEMSDVIYRGQQTTKRQTRADVIFTQFIRLVEQHFRVERRVGWYAEQLCITPKYLSETVKAVSKRTPNEWIDNYVTLEIRVLLKNTNKSIKEIAEEMHFANQSFLGKYFKERVGISPSEYRKG
ncbi:MAG: AraC family transcriptional regulator [Prevotella sp.]|nr:AraC family transcriptional regulator [Prevotella sp.]